MLNVRKRPRSLKSPQGLPTIALHVRIVDTAYYFLETEALRRGISKARLLSKVLLAFKLGQLQPQIS
jgi:hypothetical protein